MLYDFNKGRKERVVQIPFKSTYDLICTRLTADELRDINSFIDEKVSGVEITVSSFLPGADWSDTPLECLYYKAARQNFDLAAKMFGLLVYVYFMNSEESWSSGHYVIKGRDDLGRTYFKLNESM